MNAGYKANMWLDLARYDTPTIANAVEAFGQRPDSEGFCTEIGVRVIEQGRSIVGRAVTATMRSRTAVSANSMVLGALYEQVYLAEDPTIVVVADLDDPPGLGAFLGEVQGTILLRLGAVGLVTNGSVRDLEQLRRLRFGAFAGNVAVSHAYVHLEEVGVSIEVGGLRVEPGDVLHADEHGVLSIPNEVVPKVAAVAAAVVAAEQDVLNWVRSPRFDHSALLPRLGSIGSTVAEAVRSLSAVP
jgi:regulator of RNase E activity RraA